MVSGSNDSVSLVNNTLTMPEAWINKAIVHDAIFTCPKRLKVSQTNAMLEPLLLAVLFARRRLGDRKRRSACVLFCR
jgi:hypothetical protein